MDFSDFSRPYQVSVATGACEVHGAFRTVAREHEQPKCPHCVQSRIEREAREAHDIERATHLLKISGIPGRYRDVSLRAFECSTPAHGEALKQTMEWIRAHKTTPCNLVVTGGVGTGKTHLVCAAMRNLMSAGIACRYETAASLLAEIKRAYGTSDLSEAGQIEAYTQRYSVLAIDEADITRASDNDLNLLFAVINGRYNAPRTTVIVSNQTAATMPTWLGERSADRVLEGAVVVTCNWASYRRRVA